MTSDTNWLIMCRGYLNTLVRKHENAVLRVYKKEDIDRGRIRMSNAIVKCFVIRFLVHGAKMLISCGTS